MEYQYDILHEWKISIHTTSYPIASVKTIVISLIKETRSVTMNIFQKQYFLFKLFVKNRITVCFHNKYFSTAKNCMEK